MFGPGFKQLGDTMRKMQRGLDAEAEKYGMLGCSPWVAMERDYANGINFIMYFKDEKLVSLQSLPFRILSYSIQGSAGLCSIRIAQGRLDVVG